MFHLLGGDVVGMSLVPEIITARHAGMRCFALATVTNEQASAQQGIATSHTDVQHHANKAVPHITTIFVELITTLTAS
jgi:purine-nucleoside phosphorylase